MSGLAKQMKRHLDSHVEDTYLAGLWRQNLINELAWRTTLGTNLPVGYRAPSWSWAALESPIAWRRLDFSSDHRARVVEVGCSTTDNDPTGEVIAGYLILEGPMIPLWLFYEAKPYPRQHYPHCVTNDLQEELFEEDKFLMLSNDCLFATPGPRQIPTRSLLYGLLLGWVDSGSAESKDYDVLILAADGGNYRRVGILTNLGGKCEEWFDDAPETKVRIV